MFSGTMLFIFDNTVESNVAAEWVNTPASFSGGSGFRYLPETGHPNKYVVVFLGPSTQMPGYYLELGHDRFLPCPFSCIVVSDQLHSLSY
jgi:hypothetical protein